MVARQGGDTSTESNTYLTSVIDLSHDIRKTTLKAAEGQEEWRRRRQEGRLDHLDVLVHYVELVLPAEHAHQHRRVLNDNVERDGQHGPRQIQHQLKETIPEMGEVADGEEEEDEPILVGERLDHAEDVHVEVDGADERQGKVEGKAPRQGEQWAEEYLETG